MRVIRDSRLWESRPKDISFVIVATHITFAGPFRKPGRESMLFSWRQSHSRMRT